MGPECPEYHITVCPQLKSSKSLHGKDKVTLISVAQAYSTELAHKCLFAELLAPAKKASFPHITATSLPTQGFPLATPSAEVTHKGAFDSGMPGCFSHSPLSPRPASPRQHKPLFTREQQGPEFNRPAGEGLDLWERRTEVSSLVRDGREQVKVYRTGH